MKPVKVYEAFIADVLAYSTLNQDECNNFLLSRFRTP